MGDGLPSPTRWGDRMTDTQRWKDQIIDFVRIRVGDLQANPANWRVHTQRQRAAVTGALDEVGKVNPLLFNQRTGRLIDGHLRQSLDPDEVWPVLVLDVDEETEHKILATLDPLAGLAETDGEKFYALVQGVTFANVDVGKLLDDILAASDVDLDFAFDDNAADGFADNEQFKDGWEIVIPVSADLLTDFKTALTALCAEFGLDYRVKPA